MSTLNVLVLLLAAVILILFAKTLFQRRGLKKKLTERFPGSRITPIRFITQDALIAGQPPSRSAAWGFLVVGATQGWVIGRFPASGAIQEFQIEQDSRIARIPKSSTGMGIPDMVRVAWNGRILFLFADKGMGGSKSSTDEFFSELSQRYATEEIELPSQKFSNMLIYPLAVILMVGVAAIFYFSIRAVPDFSIDSVDVAPDGHIAASSTRELVLLQPDESISKIISWKSLGVEKGAADLSLIDEGRLLVGDFAQGVIKECVLSQASCVPLKAFSNNKLEFRRTFKFALAPDNRTILAVDTARHRLLQIDWISGTYKISDQALCFPNRIRIGPQGQVLVADTNNHRILEWPSWQTWLQTRPIVWAMAAESPEPQDCRASPVNDAFMERPAGLSNPAKAFAQLRGGRIWPTDFTWMPDGTIWVLIGDANLRYGDLAIFDANRQLMDKAPVDASLDLAQVIARGHEVLLIDPGTDQIPVANAKGEIVRNLSVEHLEARITEIREEFEQLRRYSFIAQGVVLATLVITMLLAIFSMRRRLRQIAAI